MEIDKDKNHNFDKNTILKLLSEGDIKVTFRKKDDTIRVMICTTKIDSTLHKEETIKYDENQIRVYDVESNGWRSFKLDSVIEIERL